MSIKLNNHITIKQMYCLKKKGVNFECHGFSFFAVTDDATLIKLINEENKKTTGAKNE